MEFCKTDETGVRERHGLVAITADELSNGSKFTFDGYGRPEYSAFDQREQRVSFASVAVQNMGSFRENGFAGEQRRTKGSHRFAGP